MNQDQLIRFLMDNIDVDALANARDNGSMIMYFANVASRLQGGNVTQTQPQRNTRPGRATPTIATQPAPVQDLTEEAEDRPPRYTPPIQQAAQTHVQNNNQNNAQPRGRVNNPNNAQDRVRVSRL